MCGIEYKYNQTTKHCEKNAQLLNALLKKTKYPTKFIVDFSNEATLKEYKNLREEYIDSIKINDILLDPANYTIV